NYNVVIFNPGEVKRRGIDLASVPVSLNEITWNVERAILGTSNRVTFIGSLEGETHHVLFSAFDLVLTRAGGGTVNNAIACGVPLVLVEERGMWQVELIRQSCLKMGIATSVTLESFTADARGCIEENSSLKKQDDQRRNIRKLGNQGEIWLCKEL